MIQLTTQLGQLERSRQYQGRLEQILHAAQPGLADRRQLPAAEPLAVEGGVVGQDHISRLQHRLEALQGLMPGLRLAAHRRIDAIDRLGRIGLAGQQERDLGQHGPVRHIEQHRPHLDALILFGVEARGFGVENQQAARAASGSRRLGLSDGVRP